VQGLGAEARLTHDAPGESLLTTARQPMAPGRSSLARRRHSVHVQRADSKLAPSVLAAGGVSTGPGRLGCLGCGRTGGGQAGLRGDISLLKGDISLFRGDISLLKKGNVPFKTSPQKETPPCGGVRSLLVRRRAGGPAALSLFSPVCRGSCPSTSLPSRWPCPPFLPLTCSAREGGKIIQGAARLPWCGCDRPGRPGAQHPQSVAKRDNLRAKSWQVLYYQ
jgi:hypothetical protein